MNCDRYEVLFYPGLHQPADARHFHRACISINRLRTRSKPVGCAEILLDSGAFTELQQHGRYRYSVADYAASIRRIYYAGVASVSAAVAQDYMCEPFILNKTGLTLPDHQRLTLQRYDELLAADLPVYIMPVLQGFAPSDYAAHVRAYGERLKDGAWVGVGSVCKRQGDPRAIVRVLAAVKSTRPDLRLHGFGVKTTSLLHPGVREMLHSADSMAWSFAARKEGRNPNDWREARVFEQRINGWRRADSWQMEFLI